MKDQTNKENMSKRDIILNESFRLFLKKGYAAVSFSDLVEVTHVSRGNMFHHFRNKEDIFNHAVDRFVFEFLTNDAPELLAFTSSTPLKDFIDSRVENIGHRMKSFFMMTKGTVTPANFMSFILYLKDNYPDWEEKFQEYEDRKNSEWYEVIELAKQKGEIVQTVETEKIISSIRNIYLGLSYRSALGSRLSISELKEQIYIIYNLITK
ncbi:MAG: TetR/AcrR family transcriptional regulator [Prevotella sp.]|uniref:TetR/AcrR family transcriptional regulator n=1 Tax=Prevotella sp. TaxID=59823 RepID=UPI002A2F9490|nr:TetR/AcrR family transcriptional regulator [Prevotella sp.]MDD7317149.1 TetR/AcrR family transcriptional regulator [Prevotellaceae bacterium]MDY4019753.1 TetR/AcrR family transcriptional regulator [Prevotella sp.]